MKKPTTAIDPMEHQDVPLWVVHGGEFWPRMNCVKINRGNIWGYSIWKRQPGFRTLGIQLSEFVAREKMCFFFLDQSHALDFLRVITTPRIAK